ncbi:hypothetical protein FPOAC2_03628 [Fusarium poae]
MCCKKSWKQGTHLKSVSPPTFPIYLTPLTVDTGIAYTTADTNANTASLQEQTRKNFIATTGHITRTGRKRTTFLNRTGTAKLVGDLLREKIAFVVILDGLPYAVKS